MSSIKNADKNSPVEILEELDAHGDVVDEEELGVLVEVIAQITEILYICRAIL